MQNQNYHIWGTYSCCSLAFNRLFWFNIINDSHIEIRNGLVSHFFFSIIFISGLSSLLIFSLVNGFLPISFLFEIVGVSCTNDFLVLVASKLCFSLILFFPGEDVKITRKYRFLLSLFL